MSGSSDKGTSNSITVRGLRFHYLEWGSRGAPVMVLLHGGGQTAHTWQRVAARFATNHHIIALDARGHGDSDWAPDGEYGMDASREDVLAVARGLDLPRFVLGGMSMGAMTALCYAAEYSGTLRALVVVDIAKDLQRAGTERIVNFMYGRESFASLDDAVEYAHAYNPRRSREALRSTLPVNLRTLPDGSLRWKWDPAFINPGAKRQNGFAVDAHDWAARVGCPALVVHGAESDVVNRESGEQLAAAMPSARFVSILGAGHSVQGDNPHSLSDALAAFMASLDEIRA